MKTDTTDRNMEKEGKLPDWLEGILCLIVVFIIVCGGLAMASSFSINARLLCILACLVAKPLLTLADIRLNGKRKHSVFPLIPLLVLWFIAAATCITLMRLYETHQMSPLLEMMNGISLLSMIGICAVIVTVMILLHFPVRKKLLSLCENNVAQFKSLVMKYNAHAYLSSAFPPVNSSSYYFTKDVDISGYTFAFTAAEVLNVVALVFLFFSDRQFQNPKLILLFSIVTFILMGIPLLVMILLGIFDHTLFMRDKRKLEKTVEGFKDESEEVQNIVKGFYTLPYEFEEFFLNPNVKQRYESGDYQDKGDFIQLNVGIGISSLLTPVQPSESMIPKITIELGVELVSLTHHAAGDLLHKKMDEAGFKRYCICESKDIFPLSYKISVGQNSEKEEDLSSIAYAEERSDKIVEAVKAAELKCKEAEKAEKAEKEHTLKNRIKELRNEWKEQGKILPQVTFNMSFLLKPYEVEVNYHGKELYRGELITGQDQELMKTLSSSEFQSLEAERMMEILKLSVENL